MNEAPKPETTELIITVTDSAGREWMTCTVETRDPHLYCSNLQACCGRDPAFAGICASIFMLSIAMTILVTCFIGMWLETRKYKGTFNHE